MTRILYNNFDVFSGIAPVPLVSQKNSFIKYGEQWGEVSRISLNGYLTGYCSNINYLDGGFLSGTGLNIIDGGDFSTGISSGIDGGAFYANDGNLFTNQQYLVTNFSKDFQSLQIIESGKIIFNKPYCLVKSVNFPVSNYVRLIPFQIELDCYESGFFSGAYGILEPRNEWNFTQNKDQSLTIEHNLSCRGFNTSSNNSNALQNAINYIANLSGYNGQITPYFINICSGLSPCLISQKENINRVQGTYSVNETYIFDPFFNSGVLRYTATYDSGIADGISTVKIAGNLKSCRNYPIDFVRNRYRTFDSFSSAVDLYSGSTNGQLDLNPFYVSSGIAEDSFSKTLNFDITFNNDQTPNPYLDYNVTFNRDNLTDITNAQFQGTIRGRGDLKTRYQRVLNFYTEINPYVLTLTEYQNDGYQYFLNPNPLSQSVTRNSFIGEISLGATYTDKTIPPTGFDSIDYNLNFEPPIRKFSATPILDGTGSYYVVDLGYVNREVVRLQGQAVVSQAIPVSVGILSLSNYINTLGFQYVSGNRIVLEDQQIIQGNRGIGHGLSFSAVWSSETKELVI